MRETAEVLELSEANIKTLLHRARQHMADYDQQRRVPSPSLSKRTEHAIKRFALHLATDNVRGIEALLREDVLELTDPGEFIAARKLIFGREKVSLFIRKVTRLADQSGKAGRMCILDLNGMPALVTEVDPPRTDFAPRHVFLLDVDEQGRVRGSTRCSRRTNTGSSISRSCVGSIACKRASCAPRALCSRCCNGQSSA